MKLNIKPDIRLYIFVFVFLCYSFVLVYTLHHPQIAFTGDAGEYVAAAQNIIKNHVVYCGDYGKEIRYDLFSRRPPFYPLLIAVALKVANSPLLILLFQMALTLLSGIVIFRMLNLQNVSSSVKILVTACFLLYPSQIIFTNFIMSEIVLQCCLLLSFYCLFQYGITRGFFYLLLFNLCLAIAVLTKPVMLYFCIVNVLLHGWLYYKHRNKIILLFPLMLFMVIGLWSFRNYQLSGVFHYSSIKNHNLLQYNVKGFLIKQYGVHEAENIISKIESTARGKLAYKEQYEYIQSESWQIFKQHRWSYVIYHVRGFINFFLDPGRFDVYSFLQIKTPFSF